MWTTANSVVLSRVATWIIIVLALALAVLLPVSYLAGFYPVATTVWLIPLYFAFLVPALAILLTLDGLLRAIQREEIFTKSNVRRLRRISWCCFAAAFVLALGIIPGAHFCLVLAILAVFFGIIIRIVKNLFEAAVELKAENDYTI